MAKKTTDELHAESVERNLEQIIRRDAGIVSATFSDNKDAAMIVAQIEIGTTVIQQVAKRVATALPVYVRGYATEPIGEVLIANVINAALKQYRGTDPRALYIAEAVMLAGTQAVAKSFDIPGLVDDLLDGINIPTFADPAQA